MSKDQLPNFPHTCAFRNAIVRATPLPLDILRLDLFSSRITLKAVDYSSVITIEPDKRSGKPCIRGMRITVSDVLDYLASGMTEAEILSDFPELTQNDVRACLAFAADRK